MSVSKDCCCELGAECPHASHWCAPPELPTVSPELIAVMAFPEDVQTGGQKWRCDECGRDWETYRVDLDPRTPEVVLKHLRGPTLGWRSLGNDGADHRSYP